MGTISDRYGVEQPIDALRRLLVERIGEHDAHALMQAYRVAAQRYQRAVRVETARRHLDRRGDAERIYYVVDRNRYQRYQLLVDHAAEYIAGTWSMPRGRELEATDE